MENKLEQLFNSLIKRGRVSFRDYDIAEFNQIGNTFVAINYEGKVIGQFSFRQIVSKESGLWQFVCENGMVNVDETEVYYFWLKRKGTLDRGHYYLSEAGEDIRTNNFEYRLIESALKDESELEDFLLSNIVIKDE